MSPEEKPPEENVAETDPVPAADVDGGSMGSSEGSSNLGANEPVEAMVVAASISESDSDSQPGSKGELRSPDNNDDSVEVVEVVEAEIVELQNGSGALPAVSEIPKVSMSTPASNLDNIAANGGAVGAIVLGVWSLIGAFITNWSAINAVLGLMMGFWGLTSRRKNLAMFGIVLCIVSLFLSLVQVTEIINTYWNAVDESKP